ncbi:hypothetical protein Sros01_37050 [Streptomyces roseochromogenus]|nr:hypothetical protein Sros01_37050 [Streptomyces roseochromogenus]
MWWWGGWVLEGDDEGVGVVVEVVADACPGIGEAEAAFRSRAYGCGVVGGKGETGVAGSLWKTAGAMKAAERAVPEGVPRRPPVPPTGATER